MYLIPSTRWSVLTFTPSSVIQSSTDIFKLSLLLHGKIVTWKCHLDVNVIAAKDYKKPKILFYLQASKLACHSFTGVCRDMRLLVQRQRIFLLMAQQKAWTSCSQYFSWVLRPMGVMWSNPGALFHMQWICVMVGKPWVFKDCSGINLLKEPLCRRGLLANLPNDYLESCAPEGDSILQDYFLYKCPSQDSAE